MKNGIYSDDIEGAYESERLATIIYKTMYIEDFDTLFDVNMTEEEKVFTIGNLYYEKLPGFLDDLTKRCEKNIFKWGYATGKKYTLADVCLLGWLSKHALNPMFADNLKSLVADYAWIKKYWDLHKEKLESYLEKRPKCLF